MIRPYQPADRPAVINLLQLNTPKFFHPHEKEDFSHYLEHEVEDFYVFEDNSKILAVGGINYGFNQGTTARISWDMVHPDHQGQGIGAKLLRFRIEKLRQESAIKAIEVRTTQFVYPFYQKSGFKLIQQQKDYWAPGYDLYRMELKI